jgi:Zn-dependent metalloprotease
MRHRLLQQYYKGIPLEGMGYRVHEKDGFVTSANGRAVRNINPDIRTTISEEHAFQLAVKYLSTKDNAFRHGKKLIVSKDFTFIPESFSIAFQFDIDVSLIERWRISIDARNGQLINKVSLVNTCGEEIEPPLPYGTGTGLTNYYGNQIIRVEKFGNNSSRLIGQTEHGGIIGTYDFRNVNVLSLLLFFEFHDVYEFSSSTNTYNTDYHKPAVSVQWAAEQAYEYYFNKHSRNSFDNKGSAIKSYVHVGNFNNAMWTHNLMAFGNDDNNNPLVELDVVAHELTHGVTQFEAGLQYYNESGALNESFSDIFGKAIEFDTFGDSATWVLAKYNREGGLRNISNPNLKNQPDTYGGDMWHTTSDDNGGVHFNSGVQNFWFYLLCEGGSGVNDQKVSYSVNSIGMDAATKIAYRNLTEYLSSYSDYLDSRIGSLLATADLYGKNSSVYQEVDKAWDAVGVIDEPIITSLEVFDITGTTVKIKGSLIPRGDIVTYHFEYGTTPAFGSSSPVYSYTDKVQGVLTGLQSKTKYYLRLVATNENGSSFFPVEFTTLSLAPMVKIKQTVDITETTATLYGQINPNSLSTSFYFEYGLTPAFGLVTQTFPLSGITEFVNISASIMDLQPRQTYYYRLVATNSSASSVTESVSLFTAVKPVIIDYTPATARIDAEITITGNNFNPIPGKNIVRFGATRATILSSSSTTINVKVPAGASLGPISVFDTESGLTAESVQEFVPTFAGEFKKNDLHRNVGINDTGIYETLVEDMDGDNKPDIIASLYDGFLVFQNVNQGGDITAESFIRYTQNDPDLSSADLYVADVDGNGLKDIIGRSRYGIRIYPNLSVPGYIFFGVPVDLPTISSVRNFTVNDFDIDGHADVAYTSAAPGANTMVTIIRNQNPKGSLSANNFEQRPIRVLSYYADFLTTDDLDNDGLADLMIGTDSDNFLAILKNKSHPGVYEFEENIIQDPTRGRFVRYAANDLNQDGWKDIASHSPHQLGNVAIFENKATSPNITLAAPAITLSDTEGSAIQPGDINGDGKVDLLVGTGNRTLVFLENNVGAGEHLSNSSFKKFEEYGMAVSSSNSGDVSSRVTINDLNGDGRPEVIASYAYSYGPHDGYYMEVWQNAPSNCLDPSLITLDVSRSTATIVLPPNTTLDQFEIEYAPSTNTIWNKVYSTTLYLTTGRSYKLRARAKCYLGFTAYHYINFTTDCVDKNSFAVTNIDVNTVSIYANNLGSFEVQYSPAGKGLWMTLPQYSNQIVNLLPGTTYDVRFRGRCSTLTDFKYKQFTTLCPKLSALTITDIIYNKATVNWASNYAGNTILEYSANNVDWTLIDESRTMLPLIPGTQYVVRGTLACTDINADFIHSSFVTPCPKVSMLDFDVVTPFSARINWFDESGTDSYTLTYALAAGGDVTTVETSSPFFMLDGLSPGAQYKVTVAPQCIIAKDFTSITFNTVCYVPFNLSVDAITHTTAELWWSDNFSGLPYFIDYSISGSNVWQTTETPLTNISLAELRPGTEYEVRVHINCTSVTAPYISLHFETDLYEETALAPNPTDSKITIYPSKNLIGNHFSIHDNAGRVLVDGELLDYTMDLSNFPPGIYALKIEGEKTMKIVKN